MRQIHLEATLQPHRPHERFRLGGLDLPRSTAGRAVQVTVIGRRKDVELLATVSPVRVPDEAELLQHVEGAVDGRWDRVRVHLAAAIEELRARDMALRLGEDADQESPLGRPTETTVAQPEA